jgi:hypothetical protein
VSAGRGGLVDLAAEQAEDYAGRDPLGLPDDLLDTLVGLLERCAREVGVGRIPDPRAALRP